MFKEVDSRKKYSEMEEDVLAFWKRDGTFEKSIGRRPEDKLYSFYDGPPFITGVPHHGTLLSSIVKDCVPRYWTMKGFRVERRWGWDCHGLPAENMVERKLGIKSKKEIEGKIGIRKFNEACLALTSEIAAEWEGIISRIGRWVEFKNAYKTMDPAYMESIWWVFKQLHQKGLAYEDVRISLYCPRCATPLSNFEIAMDNSYEEDTDTAVFVKFEMDFQDDNLQIIQNKKSKTSFLAWTTTPWTLLANVAIAVNPKLVYAMVRMKKTADVLILAKDRLSVLEGQEYDQIQDLSGKDLVGLKYKPLFSRKTEGRDSGNAFTIVGEDFISAEEGTGIVHLAPAFGEDDFKMRKKYNLPLIINVDEEGKFISGRWKGQNVWEANEAIVMYLGESGHLHKSEKFTHSYPHCHRCGAKLIYKAQPAWFVDIEKIRAGMLKKNENINWHPKFLKEGRFKKGIQNAPDWNISRDRYWGTGIPVWKCDGSAKPKAKNQKPKANCDNIKVVGSYEELEQLSGVRLEDYHRPGVDEITFVCERCGGTMRRIPQVFDSWIEAGSMPFAQFHYPFENEERFKKSFPADFISEYIAQTRAWFYVLHVLAVGIFDSESFKNVVTTGTIAGQDGRKMSKSLGNYTDPGEIIESYSADALRFYFLSSPLMNARNINFSAEAIRDLQRGMFGTLWNSYSFFVLYANLDKWDRNQTDQHEVSYNSNLLDRWILSELHQLIMTVDENMQAYNLVKATKPIEKFIDDLSNWYIRRSRRRFWKSESDADKKEAYRTLWEVLVKFSRVVAPFCPFIAEEIHKNLTGEESVHLCDFPEAESDLIDKNLSKKMQQTRLAVELGLSLRAEHEIKVRQPLARLAIIAKDLGKDHLELIKDEVNVKDVLLVDKIGKEFVAKEDRGLKAGLDVELTEELKLEGQMRELVRHIQNARKEADFKVNDRIELWHAGGEDIFSKFKGEISREILADNIMATKADPKEADFSKKVKVDNDQIVIWLKRAEEAVF